MKPVYFLSLGMVTLNLKPRLLGALTRKTPFLLVRTFFHATYFLPFLRLRTTFLRLKSGLILPTRKRPGVLKTALRLTPIPSGAVSLAA